MRFWDRFVSTLRRKAQDFIGTTPFYPSGQLPRSLYNYGREVRGGLDSNVVMAPVMWIMRTFIEAQAVVESKKGKMWAHVPDHELELLLARPNDSYDGDALWQGTILSFTLDGNAYWLKVRNRFGGVVRLWYVPHWCMEPRWPQDGSQFISHYEYAPDGQPRVSVDPRDVVHFRFGLDPRNLRYGNSPLRPLLREIFTDDEAANFSATILRNMGVPGLIVSPKDQSVTMTAAQYDRLKEELGKAYSGDNRGTPFLSNLPMEAHQFGFDPNKLMLASLRDVAEERVCAMLGLPAAVVGFGSGMQATKVGATMRELVKMAWVACLSPMQKALAKQATSQLLPDFVSQTRRFRVRFDTSDVSGFQEDDNQRADRATRLVQGGILRVDRAQEMCGLEVDDTQKVYLRPSNGLPVGPDAPKEPPPDPAGGDDDEEELPPASGGDPDSED